MSREKEELLKEREYLLQFGESPDAYRQHWERSKNLRLEDNKRLYGRQIITLLVFLVIYVSVCVVFKIFGDGSIQTAGPILIALILLSGAMTVVSKMWDLLPQLDESFAKWQAMDGIDAMTGHKIQERLEEIEEELESLE